MTDVVFSHHHPDHTVNAALFPNARIHDHWATLSRRSLDLAGCGRVRGVRERDAPGDAGSHAAGHHHGGSNRDGVFAFTHLWWSAEGPAEDPYAVDPGCSTSTARACSSWRTGIVPGHGPAFVPDATTPR